MHGYVSGQGSGLLLQPNFVTNVQALPAEQPVEWRDRAELQDLFSVYIGRNKDSGKAAVLQTAWASPILRRNHCTSW